MKKIIATLSALACAATCAFGLAACTDDNAKTHTEEQWKAALTAEITESKSFSLSQSFDKIESDGKVKTVGSQNLWVYTDSVNTYYYTESENENNNTYKSYLLKKGDRYYQSTSNGKFAEEISAEDFATTVGSYKNYIDDFKLYFGMIEARYDEFAASGSGNGTYTVDGVDKGIDFSSYSAENMELTFTHDNKTQKLTAERVDVNIEIETGVLDSVYFRQLAQVDADSNDNELMSFSYSNDYGSLNISELPKLPEFVGKTFQLVDAEVDNDDYADNILGVGSNHIVAVNNGKTVTVNADGTLSGDITFQNVSITTYTWTDEIGELTISNVNNASVPASGKTTLTGGIKLLDTDNPGSEYYALLLELEVALGNDTTATLTLMLIQIAK